MYQGATKLLGILFLVLSTLNCGGGGNSTPASSPTISAITPSGTTSIGNTVTLAATATDPANLPLTYSWSFGDGLANDTGATVYRIYNAANTYTITLTATNSGGASSTKTLPLTISAAASSSASNVVADCSGTNCSATTAGVNNSYSGTGTGIWRFDNLTNAAVTRDINIQNVAAGKTVTLLFSNGQSSTAAATTPSLGVLAAPVMVPSAIAIQGQSEQQSTVSERALGYASHSYLLQANRDIAANLIRRATSVSTIATHPSIAEASNSPAPAPIVGDTRIWNENGFSQQNYTATAQVVCLAGNLGRRVVIWAQTSPAPSTTISANSLQFYQQQFCGSTNNDGQYAKVAALLGDAWGSVPTKYTAKSIADSSTQKQDINIVIIAPATTATWGGYFYSLNNFLRAYSSSYSLSNEALVFFINARQSQNYIASVLIHELTHMINFYQRGILHDDYHDTWLEETSAMMTQDLFDPGLNIATGCLPIVCEVRDFATSGAGISYFNWPSAISAAHYSLGGAFAAFLNRKYGPAVAAQLMTDCYTPTTNTTSFACLDFLIKQNGGASFADDFAKMGASVFGRIGGSAEPSQYGFPAKNGTVTNIGNLVGSYNYALPAFNNWWAMPSTITIPAAASLIAYPYTSQTYKIDTVALGKTSYVRTGVSVPAKTSLITIIK